MGREHRAEDAPALEKSPVAAAKEARSVSSCSASVRLSSREALVRVRFRAPTFSRRRGRGKECWE